MRGIPTAFSATSWLLKATCFNRFTNAVDLKLADWTLACISIFAATKNCCEMFSYETYDIIRPFTKQKPQGVNFVCFEGENTALGPFASFIVFLKQRFIL